MKIIVVLGLIAAWAWIGVQAPSSRPAVKDNRNAGDRAGDTQHGQNSPSPTPSLVPLASPDRDKNPTGRPQADNDKGAVGTQAVTIKSDSDHPIWGTTVKDGWDKALVIGTIALVFVGACGIRYAVKTLRAINRQAELTERQLKAFVDSERARVTVEIEWQQGLTCSPKTSPVKMRLLH